MAQATLHTARLTLSPLTDSHLEDEVALDADPRVMQFLEAGRPRTRDQVVERHARRLATAAVDGFGYWVGTTRPGPDSPAAGDFVGWWIFEAVGEQRPVVTAEVGYRLQPRWWRQGLATEGSRELLRHGFEDLGVTTVIAQTMAVNEASRATMNALGLRHARTFDLDLSEFDATIPGSEHGEVEYAISREDWLTRSASDPPRPPG